MAVPHPLLPLPYFFFPCGYLLTPQSRNASSLSNLALFNSPRNDLCPPQLSVCSVTATHHLPLRRGPSRLSLPAVPSSTPSLTEAQATRGARHSPSPAMAHSVLFSVIRIISRIRLRKRRSCANSSAFSAKAAGVKKVLFSSCQLHPCLRLYSIRSSISYRFSSCAAYFPLLSFVIHPLSRTQPSSGSREAVFASRTLTPQSALACRQIPPVVRTDSVKFPFPMRMESTDNSLFDDRNSSIPCRHNIEFSCAPARSHVLTVGTWLKPTLKEQRSG